MQAVALGDRADRCPESHDLIGETDAVHLLENDGVLARREFMARGFDLKAHFFEGKDQLTPCIFPLVERGDVQIAGHLAGVSRHMTVLILCEQEEFTVGINVKGVAVIFGITDDLSEDLPRVLRDFVSFSIGDVAEKTCDFAVLRTPRKDGERPDIRPEIDAVAADFVHAVEMETVYRVFPVQSLFNLP